VFALKDASALAREPDVAAAIDAVDRYLAVASGPGRFRKSRNSGDAEPEREGYRGLADVGLTTALLPEASGGSGFAPGAAALVAERLGRSLAREPFVENIVLPVSLALALRSSAMMETTAKGDVACLAWQEAPFARPYAGAIAASLGREGRYLRLRGGKRFVMGARASTCMYVLATLDGQPAIAMVDSAADGVKRHDKPLADGSCWSDVAFDTLLEEAAVVARGGEVMGALCTALDLANLALAGQLYGLQTRILEMTLEYLGMRVQFDQPIGSFQALQHRAVDLYTHAQITRFLVGEAVDAFTAGATGRALEVYASRAKARSADAGLRIAKEGIQMHGGIGFSDEHDLGLYVKRILVLSAWLGNADWHRRRLAAIEPLAQGGLA